MADLIHVFEQPTHRRVMVRGLVHVFVMSSADRLPPRLRASGAGGEVKTEQGWVRQRRGGAHPDPPIRKLPPHPFLFCV